MDLDGQLTIGDLVAFKPNKVRKIDGYILWVGPDYEDTSLDIQTLVPPKEMMVVIDLTPESNVQVMTASGIKGWTRKHLLKKINI